MPENTPYQLALEIPDEILLSPERDELFEKMLRLYCRSWHIIREKLRAGNPIPRKPTSGKTTGKELMGLSVAAYNEGVRVGVACAKDYDELSVAEFTSKYRGVPLSAAARSNKHDFPDLASAIATLTKPEEEV